MKKLDLKKDLKALYTASAKKVTFIDVPEMNFLMVDGKGDPNGPEFQHAVEALYSTAYTMKFMIKKGPMQIDYPVMALEGLWWTKGNKMYDLTPRGDWRWTVMIMQPSIITQKLLDSAKELVAKKKDLVSLPKVVLAPYHEGLVAQTMHIGPYAEEPATVKRMDDAAAAAGYTMHGKHHEIYMSDPRRTAPEKLKTILRHPVKK